MSNKRIIITISGKKGSGKSAATEILKDIIAGLVDVYPMATKLKKVVAAVTDCKLSDLEIGSFKRQNSGYTIERFGEYEELTYRECLLHFGKLLRFDYNNVFIEDVLNHIHNSVSNVTIIPDVREVNEMEYIKDYAKKNDLKLINIRIQRRTNDNEHSNDKTETDLDNYKGFNYTIDNNIDGLKNLYDVLLKIVKQEYINVKPHYVKSKLF